MFLDLTCAGDSQLRYHHVTMPDGQPHIRLVDKPVGLIEVVARVQSFNDIGWLAITADALDAAGCRVRTLFMPYFFGARQDRRQKGEALTAKVVATFVNSLGFDSVTILHPHSDVCTALLDRVEVSPHVQFVERAVNESGADFIIIPDAGAAKSAKLYDGLGLPCVQCIKSRDPKTGRLSGFQRIGNEVPGGHGIIVDDICDGGGTFLGIRDLFPCDVSLYTTHAIYSKGIGALSSAFNNVFCTNSYRHGVGDGIVEFDCFPRLRQSELSRGMKWEVTEAKQRLATHTEHNQ